MKPEKIYVVFKNDALPFIDESDMFYYSVVEFPLDTEINI